MALYFHFNSGNNSVPFCLPSSEGVIYSSFISATKFSLLCDMKELEFWKASINQETATTRRSTAMKIQAGGVRNKLCCLFVGIRVGLILKQTFVGQNSLSDIDFSFHSSLAWLYIQLSYNENNTSKFQSCRCLQ